MLAPDGLPWWAPRQTEPQRDWLIVTRRIPPQVKAQRLAVKRAQHRAETWINRIYPRARCEYAYVLRQRGMTYREIGRRLGICGTLASGKVKRHIHHYAKE